MPLIRLIGLALFITAILLTLAAAITKTSHINVQLPNSTSATPGNSEANSGAPVVAPVLVPGGNAVLPPGVPGTEQLPATNAAAQFTSVPIIWPLIIAAGTGLLMWFLHPTEPLRKSSNSIRKSRRRK